tara:strand:- start:172 stop:360 length:189 start_codon:yes stop_codon:yes gene_type:complete
MKNYDNDIEIILLKKITSKENRIQVKRIIGLAALWVVGAYASMYGFLMFILWFNNDFLERIL